MREIRPSGSGEGAVPSRPYLINCRTPRQTLWHCCREATVGTVHVEPHVVFLHSAAMLGQRIDSAGAHRASVPRLNEFAAKSLLVHWL